ncbi:MAG: GrpB family protein [Pseudomonadota bacterium]|nr:GrpB family protein [Pseudomonadota bacterium]
MSDEIEIVDYDPNWPAAFALERGRLYDALKGQTILELAHFGSTAIEGMPAKPVIDMLLVVPKLDAAKRDLPAVLDRLGYDYWAENPKKDRLFFVRGMPPRGKRRTHHLHVCQPDGEMLRRLVFIDYLRAHPQEARAYGELKRQLAALHRRDREAYTIAKKEFIDRIIRLAKSSE